MAKYLKQTISIAFITLILSALYLISLYNYLLFHTIAEIFSICIAFTVFVLTWNSAPYIKNNYLLLVGTAYLFIGSLDLFHTMSYKGMSIFQDYDYYANQLWIATRYLESITLLIGFIFVKKEKPISIYSLFSLYVTATAVILLSIFVWKVFPVCFVEGIGLTPFKKISEYIICSILAACIILLIKNKDIFENRVYHYLMISLVCAIISEYAFTIYIDNYGFSNLVGHYFKIFSFYMVYRAIIVKGIQEPYDMIFRELKQNEQKLEQKNELLLSQAIVDGLTGLYNHRYLYDRLEEEIKRHKRHNNCAFSILMIDIDHFKAINDTHGHLTGDEILKAVSNLLKANLRQTDIAGRYGGEEFLLILPETGLDEACLVAEKIRKSVEGSVFIKNIKFSISIGVSTYSGETASELAEKADKNLYQAKSSGRNRTVF